MTKQISNWQEIRLNFFRDEIYKRFWNHTGNTKNLIIEIQYFPALLQGDHNMRIFIGAGIELDFPYNTQPNNVRACFLKDNNIEAIKEYEKEHALGFAMTGTGETRNKVYSITFTYTLKEPHDIFIRNLGINYSESHFPIFFWYNLGKDGKLDEINVEPKLESMIRVRFLNVNYFMRIMKKYTEGGYTFPPEFTQNDYKL